MRRRLTVLASVLMTTACGIDPTGGASDLPPLLEVRGRAYLPAGFHVAADTLPAPAGLQVVLRSLDGKALAVGNVVSGSGAFSLSIPINMLPAHVQLFSVSVENGDGRPLYQAPVRLSAGTPDAGAQVDARSSVLALAVRLAAQQGGDPAAWNLAALAMQPQVDSIAQDIQSRLVTFSQQGGTPPVADPAPPPLQREIAGLIATATTSTQP